MAKAGAKQNVADKPFKVASPMKESACPGDFVGTIGGKIQYMAVGGNGCFVPGSQHIIKPPTTCTYSPKIGAIGGKVECMVVGGNGCFAPGSTNPNPSYAP